MKGGFFDKVLFAYSADHYPFWQEQYKDLEWGFGMFGENLLISGLQEMKPNIGDVFQEGEAKAEALGFQEPFAKLGVNSMM